MLNINDECMNIQTLFKETSLRQNESHVNDANSHAILKCIQLRRTSTIISTCYVQKFNNDHSLRTTRCAIYQHVPLSNC